MDSEQVADDNGTKPQRQEAAPNSIMDRTPVFLPPTRATLLLVISLGYISLLPADVLAAIPIEAPVQIHYRVQSGDTLWDIARAHDVDMREIIILNKIRNPRKIKIGQILIIPERKVEEKKTRPEVEEPLPQRPDGSYHKVVKGDTLWEIARAYKVKLSRIVEENREVNPNRLKIGQLIFIPDLSYRKPEQVPPPVPEEDAEERYFNQLCRYDVSKPKDWKYIVIHHSATDIGNAKRFERFHREERHMEYGLAYHFVIGNGNGARDGEIEVGNRWKRQLRGGHTANLDLNEVAIGICLVGNFEKDYPTNKEIEELYKLTKYLIKRYNIPPTHVITHRDVYRHPRYKRGQRKTACPGKYFPYEKLKGAVRDN